MRGLKEKAARSGWLSLLVGVLMGGWASPAHAQEPRVLLLEPDGAPTGLHLALQIQLAGIATVERIPQQARASAAQRVEIAGEFARERAALCAVSVEPPPAGADGPAILYAVGEREGRALIEVVRVPGGAGPELDRTLALKVREIVTELILARAAAPAETLLLPPPPAATPGPPATPRLRGAARSRQAVGAAVALGARLGSQPRVGLGRWGVGLAAGPTISRRSLRFAAQLGADWFPPVTVANEGDRARFHELAGTLVLQAQRRIGDVWIGAEAGPQHVWLDAQGTTALERRGRVYRDTLWALVAALGGEIAFGEGLGFAAQLQLQTLLRDQRLTVNGREVVEFGRVRARLGISLTYRPFDD